MEDAGGVLALFDLYWFQDLILRRSRPPPTEAISPAISVEHNGSEYLSSQHPSPPPISTPTLLLRRHRRSRSDDLYPFTALRIKTPKLQTILSGKVSAEDPNQIAPQAGESRERRFKRALDRRWLRSRKNNGKSKSLTDLEFEELKGLMDLGFTFSDAEAADPRLISIVPGLQRMREAATDDGNLAEETSSSASEAAEEGAVPRPYLSEAWYAAAAEEERGNDLLTNWRIPAASEVVDLKEHLRLWAQAVASAVR